MNLIVSESLLRHLRETFPDKVPRTKSVSIEDLRFTQGTLRVIDYLEDLYSKQNPTEELLHVFSQSTGTESPTSSSSSSS